MGPFARRDAVVTTLCSLVIATSLTSLSGCVATMPSSSPGGAAGYTPASYTPAEQNLRKQAQLFSKTSMQGCVAGAAAGALLGLLVDSTTGGGHNSRRNSMLIGAAGGCAAGVATNVYVQNKRNQYYDSEARINAMIVDVREDNQRLSNLVSATREVIADDKRRIAEVNRQYRDKKISAAEARAQLARVKENRHLLDGTIDNAKKTEASWSEIAATEKREGVNTARLDQEINQLKKTRAQFEQELTLMDREIAASPVAA